MMGKKKQREEKQLVDVWKRVREAIHKKRQCYFQNAYRFIAIHKIIYIQHVGPPVIAARKSLGIG